MARLSRVHFAGLGTDSARFNPVTLDFRDAQGRASHAVMWLRNGGGKTTMLSFLYSTLRPHANDWLGRHNGRQTDLLEYVKERQTGYVLLEFEFPNLGIRRVVGQAISKRSAREPKRVYFTFRGDGPVPWEKIPLTGLGEPAGSLELFVEKMRSLGEGAGNSLEFYQTDRQGDWRTHLDSIGLDPEIYHTHLLMNADEGGLLNFFDFNSPETFVEKLLDMAFETLAPVEEAGDKQGREDLTAVIEKFRQKVFARPNLDATAAFCQHTLSALEALKTELDVVGQFRQQREVYRGQAARLLVSVERHLTTLKAEVEQLTKEREVSAKAKKDALNRRDEHRKFKKHYDRRRQLLILKESEIALLEAEQNKVKEEAWLAALKTAHRRRRLTECERLIAGFVRQKQELESAHEPDRKALERLGRAISDILSQRIAELETRFNRLTAERGGAHREWQGLQADLLKLAKEMTGADHSLATVRAFLNEADNERRKLRDQGVLLPPAETGAEAVKRWQGKAQSHQDNASRLAVEISNGEARLAGLGHQVKEKQNQCVTVSSEIARLNTWLETMSLQAMRLRTETMIMRELGDAPNADLHNPALETALTRFADDCQRTYLAKTVEGAADRRIVEYCRNHPNTTFPAPVGIEHVIEKLRAAGVTSAIPAYRWLSENCEAGEAARRMLLQPALYAGIVVQIPKELEVARSVIMAEGLDLPVMVGVPADLATSDSQPRQHTILPEEKGFFSTALAQINLVRVVNRAAGRDAEIDQLKVDQKATEGVLGRLREHVRTYPAKSVEEKRSEQDVQQRLLAAHQAALEDLNKEISTLTDRLKELREKKQVQESDAASAREHLGRAQGFFSTYESRVPTRREEERLLIGTIQGLTARENEIKGRVTSLEELMGRLDPQIATTRLDQRDFTLRKQLLPAQFIGTEPATDAGEDLPSLFDAFEGKRRDYEGQVKASYFDAKVEEEQKHKAAVEGEQMRDPVRPPEADVDLAMAETDLAKAVEDQVAVIADVAVEVTTARRALEKADRPPPLAQSERDTPHPDFGVPETSVQAAEFAQQCENLSAQFETEASAADTNLTLVSNRHEVSARACDRYDNFPARLRPLAAELAGAAEASGEFCGDDVKDRVLVDTVETNFKSCQDDLDRAQTRAGRIYTEQYTGVFQLRELEGKTIDAVEKMRRLPRSDLEERVSFWIEEIRTHNRVVVAELAEFAQEQKTVLGLMNDCVRDAEAVLTAAQTRSKMPENMGAWAGHHFLRIAVRRRNDLPERLVLLERMLSEWIDSKNPKPIPSGAKLAYHCLVAVAGKGQIEVKILKPEYNLRPFQHDIVKLKSFSGGEQVTAAIILYCIIVKLRAQRRGRATSLAEDSGFLLLDNPLGKANLPDFVDLQISMADRMGVQYICGTGINDLDALAGFPKIIRLRNSSINPRTGANIVEVEGQEYADISVATLGNKDHGKTGE